jgi:DNA-binding GntR family transcriptional regulator
MRPDEIVTLLRRAIRERVLVPGQSLNQDDLAKRFGVSRIPLREALRTLVGEGLVAMRPGIGAVVTELDPAELDELLTLRALLEPPLLAGVVNRAGPADFAGLRQMVTRLADIAENDQDAWSSQEYLFHRRVFELAGLPHSLRLATQVLNLLEPYAWLLVGPAGLRDHNALDCAIVDALEAGDTGRASELAAEELARARRHMNEVLPSLDAGSGREDPLDLLRDVTPHQPAAPVEGSPLSGSAPAARPGGR